MAAAAEAVRLEGAEEAEEAVGAVLAVAVLLLRVAVEAAAAGGAA